MTITLTVRARLNLMRMLRDLGSGKMMDDNLITSTEIFKKIRIPEDVLKQYEKVIPGMGVLTDMDAVNAAPEITVELDPTETKKLIRMIGEYTWTVYDYEWRD